MYRSQKFYQKEFQMCPSAKLTEEFESSNKDNHFYCCISVKVYE